MPDSLDYFTVLEEERRPWLDPEALKHKFIALSGRSHPDRFRESSAESGAAQDRFTTLNTAYNCIREPRHRLRHLLELELGKKPADLQEIPSGLIDVFIQHGKLCREADAFLAERAKVNSPLVRVQYWERGQVIAEKLLAWQSKLSSAVEELNGRLKAADSRWIADTEKGTLNGQDRDELLGTLSELFRLFSYYWRWASQVQERIVQLTMT
jgi:hypothetical protein